MDELIEYVKDRFDLRSMGEKEQIANARIERERNLMEREKIRLEMELEDTAKRRKRAAEKDDRYILDKEAMNTVKLEERMKRLDNRDERLSNVVYTMAEIRCAQLETNCVLLSMEASVGSNVANPEYVQAVTYQYSRNKESMKIVQEEIKDALAGGSSEELEESGANMTDEQRERMEGLIKGEIKEVNRKFISDIPTISGATIVPSSILGMSERELVERNANGTKKLEEFMLKKTS